MKTPFSNFWIMLIIFVLILHIVYNHAIVFISEPEDRFIIIGARNITIPCQATSKKDGKLTILWKHNDTYITDYDNKHFRQIGQGSLFFIQFLHRDVGDYQCTIIRSIQTVREEQISSKKARYQAAYIGSSFKYVSNDLRAALSSTYHLQCVTPDSLPSATVIWFKDEVKLSGCKNGSLLSGLSTTSTLELTNFTFGHVGTYKCIAYNAFLNVQIQSPKIAVNVKANKLAPYFYLQPSSKMGTRFFPVYFDCILLGDPKPILQWIKNGIDIKNNTRFHILKNGTLQILAAQRNDEGSYTCIGSNHFGSIQSVPAKLSIAYIDYDFIQDPLSQVIVAGEDLVLHCIPPHSYPDSLMVKWFCNYKQLTQSASQRLTILSNSTLHLKNITRKDEGSYFCQATNSFSGIARTSTHAKITIHVLPAIVTNQTMEVLLGNQISIICNTSGVPSPNMTISKKITESNGSLVVVSNKQSFTITSAKTTDEGTYVCMAQNEAGITNMEITLTVLVQPFLSQPLQNQSSIYRQDSLVQFSCGIVGKPLPAIEWYYNNNPMQTRPGYDAHKRKLTINRPSKKNEGWYTCKATNKVGSVSSKAFLKVYEPPFIMNSTSTLNLTVYYVEEHQNLTLLCSVRGDPAPQISWRLNGGNLSTLNTSVTFTTSVYAINSHSYIVTSRLQLTNISFEEHSGRFECTGLNEYGGVTQSTQVIVQVPPTITSFDTNSNTFEQNTTLKIHCTAYGSPTPEITLLHNSSTLLTIKSRGGKYYSTLWWEVERLSPLDSGAYECNVRSELGMTQRNISIVVKVKPGAPFIQNFTATSPRSISLAWSLPFNGYSSIHTFIVEITSDPAELPINKRKWVVYSLAANTQPATRIGYELSNLEPYTMYWARMKAINGIGESVEYSKEVNITTFPEAPSKVLDLLLVEKTSRNVTLRWRAPKQKNGRISFYELFHSVNKTLRIPFNDTLQIQERTVFGLSPYTEYQFKIRAGTHFKQSILWSLYSNSMKVLTLEDLPGTTITSLQTSNITAFSFRLQFFLNENLEKLHGRFKDFQLHLVSTTSPVNDDVFLKTTNTWFLFDGLAPHTKYEVRVAVRNNIGVGPYSEPFEVETLMAAPGVVENVVVTELNSTTIQVVWQEPKVKNGIIERYKIVVISQMTNISAITYYATSTYFYSNNFTVNSTYVISVVARTSAGYSNSSDAVLFTTSANFRGLSALTTTPPATIIPPSLGAKVSWLDREYMVVIVAVSAFAVFLLLSICVVCIVRLYHVKHTMKGRKTWESNPYYDGNSIQILGNQFTSRKRPTVVAPATALTEFQTTDQDLIWDDDVIDDLVDASSLEPEYAIARTPIMPPSPAPSSEDPRRANYASVDPYQGRSLELSPLVRLKGMNKNRRHPKVPSAFSPSKQRAFTTSPYKEPHESHGRNPSYLYINKDIGYQPTSSARSSARSARSSSSATPLTGSSCSGNRGSTSDSSTNNTNNNDEHSRTSSLRRLDINDMYSDVVKQRRHKDNKRRRHNPHQRSGYEDMTTLPLPHGDLGPRDYHGTQY